MWFLVACVELPPGALGVERVAAVAAVSVAATQARDSLPEAHPPDPPEDFAVAADGALTCGSAAGRIDIPAGARVQELVEDGDRVLVRLGPGGGAVPMDGGCSIQVELHHGRRWARARARGEAPPEDVVVAVDRATCSAVAEWRFAWTTYDRAPVELLAPSEVGVLAVVDGEAYWLDGPVPERVVGVGTVAEAVRDEAGDAWLRAETGTWRLGPRGWVAEAPDPGRPCDVVDGVAVDLDGRALPYDAATASFRALPPARPARPGEVALTRAAATVPAPPPPRPAAATRPATDTAPRAACATVRFSVGAYGSDQVVRTDDPVEHYVAARVRAPVTHGGGATLTDGAERCGEPRHPAPFRDVLGDCDGFVGITELGAVFAGDRGGTRRLFPPVGVPRALAGTAQAPVVGGDAAIAWDTGSGWRRVAVPAPVEQLALDADGEPWWTDGRRVCHAARACADAPGVVEAIAPVRGALWALVTPPGARDPQLWRYDGDWDAPGATRATTSRFGALLSDPDAAVLFTEESGALVRRDPTTGAALGRAALRSYADAYTLVDGFVYAARHDGVEAYRLTGL